MRAYRLCKQSIETTAQGERTVQLQAYTAIVDDGDISDIDAIAIAMECVITMECIGAKPPKTHPQGGAIEFEATEEIAGFLRLLDGIKSVKPRKANNAQVGSPTWETIARAA